MPGSYDCFLAGLKASTAKRARRDQKKFDSLSPEYQLIAAPEDVADFVRHAAMITSLAGKLERGAGGVADMRDTHEQLGALAQRGRLRGYLAFVGGKPVAFAWGDIANNVFYLRETAFDPALGKYSRSSFMRLLI